MKKFTGFLREFFLLQRFQVYVLMFLLVFSLSSCFQKYYNTNTAVKTDPATLEKFRSENKLFIVHTPEGPFALKNVTVSGDMIYGDKAPLNSSYDKYLNPESEGSNHLQMSKSDVVLNQVHLYTNSEFSGSGKVDLKIADIFRTDAYGFDKNATKKSSVASVVGIVVTTGAVIGVSALAANSMSHMFDGATISMRW
jgi:hypothetical protein